MKQSASVPITVIIPTRERLSTLRESLETTRAQDYGDLTIIVSDNASADATGEYVRSLRDPRIHYVNPGRRLSMAENYEFALDSAPRRDGWAMLIGDDDGLMPGAAARAAELIRELRPEAIRSQPCSYSWPSLTGLPHGRLGVPIGSGLRVIDARSELCRVVRGHSSYHRLPMVYQGGVLPLSLLDRIKARTGTFFRSCIPDVYSAMAISSCISTYVLLDEPLAINGLSGQSIGMSQARDRFADQSPARQFQRENLIAFHPDVPLREDGDYPVGQPLVYEPFLQSEFLRTERLTSHHEQLVLSLAEAMISGRDISSWAGRFAELHGLKLDAAHKSARQEAVLLWARRTREKAKHVARLYVLGSAEEPITTVREAAVAAGAVRETVRSRRELIPNLTARLWARLGSRLTSKRR